MEQNLFLVLKSCKLKWIVLQASEKDGLMLKAKGEHKHVNDFVPTGENAFQTRKHIVKRNQQLPCVHLLQHACSW